MITIKACLAGAAFAFAAASANAQFQARDFNGDGSTDAWYDVAQDLTWLADANHAYTSGWWADNAYAAGFGTADPQAWGTLTVTEAFEWAAQLEVHGVSGWRLPTVRGALVPNEAELARWGVPPGYFTQCSQISVGAGGGDLCSGGPSELAGLAGHTDLFANLSLTGYGQWLGASWQSATGLSFFGIANAGSSQVTYNEQMGVPLRVMAVRDGDVAPVPEPSTYVLMALGLAALGWRSRKQSAGAPDQV